MDTKNYKNIYNKLSSIIQDLDPANLGGAIDEYDPIVNELIKLISLDKSITKEDLKNAIKNQFPNIMNIDDLDMETVIDKISYIKILNLENKEEKSDNEASKS